MRDHPVGSTIEGEIKSITEFGLFIGLDSEIDGMVHLSDLTWRSPATKPSRTMRRARSCQAKVLDVDAEKERVSLGIKQLGDDPIEKAGPAGAALKKNQVVTVTVTEVNDGGIEVQLADGIKAFIRRSDLARDRNDQRPERFQVATRSMRSSPRSTSRAARSRFRSRRAKSPKRRKPSHNIGSSDSGASLGDILGAALKKRGGKKGDEE